MGQSFGQSFADSFSKTLPQALQYKVQLEQQKQLRDIQAGFQYEQSINNDLSQAALHESKGDFGEADRLRTQAKIKQAKLQQLYGGGGNQSSALGGILSQIPQTILHPIQTGQKIKNAFTGNPTQPPINQTQPPINNQNQNINQGINNPSINVPMTSNPPKYDDVTQRAYEAKLQKEQSENEALDLRKQQIPSALHGVADSIIKNPGLTAKEKNDELSTLAKEQNQYLPDSKDTDFLDESQNLIESIDTAKQLLQSDKTLTGGNSLNNTSKTYREYQQQLQRIDSILKNRKLAPGQTNTKGIDFNTIAPLGGWQTILQGDRDALNKLDLIREQALNDFNQKKTTLQSHGKKLGVFDTLDLSQPVKLKDFKSPEKVKSMIDAGVVDFKQAGDIINKAVGAKKEELEQPVDDFFQGWNKKTVDNETVYSKKVPNPTVKGGTEIIFKGRPPQAGKTPTKPQMVNPPSNTFAFPEAPYDDVQKQLQNYHENGTPIQGTPPKGNLKSEAKPGSQAHFINTLARTAPSLKTIVTLANTIKSNGGVGINKELINQLDRDGATLLDLSLAYLENEGQAA